MQLHPYQVIGNLRTAMMEAIDYGQRLALSSGRKRKPTPHKGFDFINGPVVGRIGQASVQSTSRLLAQHHGATCDGLAPCSKR